MPGEMRLRQFVWEDLVGLLLILMVFLAVKYGMREFLYTDTSPETAVAEAAAEAEKRLPAVVIDAGHGGADPGKVGPDGCLEKEINLQIACRLQYYLEQAGVSVMMTREADQGLYGDAEKQRNMTDLRNRCRLINGHEPDLAVSIHQNSFPDSAVSGGQIFYHPDSPEGKRLAELLQKRFTYVSGADNRRQAKANDSYYLLRNVDCPLVIAECGFLSNPEEMRLLQEADYQDRMAWTLHMGVLEYLASRR